MKYVLYHANCADGFCAAWVAWKRFGEDAKYIPVHYGQRPPKMEPGAEVYLLDFSYKPSVLTDICQTANMVTVIDHHKTFQEDLIAATQDNWLRPANCKICFNIDHSGGRLT